MDTRKITILIFIIVSCTVLTGFQIKGFQQGNLGFTERTAASAVKPAQEALSGTGRRISGFWQFITQGSRLERENKELKAKIGELREKEDLFTRTGKENRELRKLLNLVRNQKQTVIAAEVIARDPDNWFRTLKVNKGSKDGVTVDMIAVSSEGLVGRVISTADNISNIRLIFNEKSAVPAQIVSSGELGMVYGEGTNTCVMKFIIADADIKVGDQVITSNLSKIYPPGKVIGKVSKMYGRDQILYQAVQVKPAVQFSNLEFVLLIGKHNEQ